MNLLETVSNLSKIFSDEKVFFVYVAPEILDFSNKEFEFYMNIFTRKGNVSLSLNSSNVSQIICILKDMVFFEKASVLSWNIKNLFTYVYFVTKVNLNIDCNIIDIKIMECFLGNRNKSCPKNLTEAINRYKSICANSSYDKLKLLYGNIYIPLITKVLPEIEVLPVGDVDKKHFLYSYYEIEGQVNGRLCCSKAYRYSYNPHSLDTNTKIKLKTVKTLNDYFISFDFNSMEVYVLEWLSKDESIKNILNKYEDFYQGFAEEVLNIKNDNKRILAKKIFLPLVYGQGERGLSESLKVSLDTAKRITERVKKCFKKTFDWIGSYKIDQENACYDILGRRRVFAENDFLPIYNFLVQAPANMVCLEKLILLYKSLLGYGHLMCSIHDGYIVIADKKTVESVMVLGKNVLEKESEICKGLKLKINCKFGKNLGELDNE